jgi:hypothetical protein
MSSFSAVRRATRPFPVVALTLAAAVNVAGAQTVSLRTRYEANAEHVFRSTLTSTITGGFGNQTQTMTSVSRQRVISAAADGSAVIRLTTESMKMVMDGPMGRIEYDSETGVMPTGPTASIATALADEIGKSRDMEVSKDGKIRIENGSFPVSFSTSDELLALPVEAVAIGAEWDRQSTVTISGAAGGGGTMKANGHFRLTEVATRDGRRIAVIEMTMKGTLERDPSAPGAELIGSTLPVESTGEIHFDLDRGLTVRTAQRQTATMTMMGESMQTITETVTEIVP